MLITSYNTYYYVLKVELYTTSTLQHYEYSSCIQIILIYIILNIFVYFGMHLRDYVYSQTDFQTDYIITLIDLLRPVVGQSNFFQNKNKYQERLSSRRFLYTILLFKFSYSILFIARGEDYYIGISILSKTLQLI